MHDNEDDDEAADESSKSVSEQVAEDVEEDVRLRNRVAEIEEGKKKFPKYFPWIV
jgi:hypothetical protein